MALQAGDTPNRTPVLLGLDLLVTVGRLLWHHWLPLSVIAVASLVVQVYVLDLAVLIGRNGAIPGRLGLALVPFVPLLAIIGMLLVLRRRSEKGSVLGDVLAGLTSALVPFLVVYQSNGRLEYDVFRFENRSGADSIDAGPDGEVISYPDRLPLPDSGAVIAVVVAAFVFRVLGGRVVRAGTLWRREDDPRRRVLQIVVGYAEILWLVLGAIVLTYAFQQSQSWLTERRAARWLEHLIGWVEGFWPSFGLSLAWLTEALGFVASGVLAGLIVPLSWLTIGAIIYGVRAAEVVHVSDLIALRRKNSAFRRLTERIGMAPIVRAWKLLTNSDGRFGALIGASAMILKAGWIAVFTYCFLFLAVNQLPYALWFAVRSLTQRMTAPGWQALESPINLVSEALVLVMTTVLLAASADALLSRFGAPSWLRLPEVSRQSNAVDPAGSPDTREQDENTEPISPDDAAEGAAGQGTADEHTVDADARPSDP